MAKEVNKELMKKRLKDANIYEENMPDDLMAEFYEAVKNSETSLQEESQKDVLDEAEKSLNESANELLEAINNSESIAPSERKLYASKSDDDDSLDAFSQDIMPKSKTKLSQDETNNNNHSIHIIDEKAEENENIVDMPLNMPIGFNDMPKSQKNDKNMLKIISHELKYINIQNSKKFLTANSETRIKMLHNHHFAAAKLVAQCASLSTNMVPTPKPITAIDHDLCVNPVISTLKDEESHLLNETYVSRSGRHTKRKMYNEFDDTSLDSLGSPKRTKTAAKEKAPKASAKKATQEEVISSNNNDYSERITLKEFIDEAIEAKEALPKQPKRTYQRKNLSNDEIMNRSPLFKDLVPLKRGRTGAILNAAKEETEKQNKQEVEMVKFTNSLDFDSQDFEDDSEKIIIDVDEVVERRRVVPTLPMSRKPIHGRKRGGGVVQSGPEPLNITVMAKRPTMLPGVEEAHSNVTNGVARKNAVPKRLINNNNTDRNEPSTSSSTRARKDVNMTVCPLCSLSFPQKEIEEHAATCGEDMFPQTAQPQRITCEICDSVVPFTTDYEVHVRDCTAKRNGGV